MKSLSSILGIVRNGKWHKTNEIARKTSLSEEKLNMALSFLKEMDTVELSENALKVRITDFGRDIIQLPKEEL